MTDIADENSLGGWLKGKPPAFACALATRTALRMVPLLREALREDEMTRRGTIALVCFRALATANFASAWPGRAEEMGNAALAAAFEIRKTSEAISEIIDETQINLIEYRDIPEAWRLMADIEANDRSLRVADHAVTAAMNAIQATVDQVDTAKGVASPEAAVEATVAAVSAAHRAVDGAHGY